MTAEFISKAVDLWAYENQVVLDFSRPGKPTNNPFIESFNGSFRDKCLNLNWFLSLDDAQEKTEAWRASTTINFGLTNHWETSHRCSLWPNTKRPDFYNDWRLHIGEEVKATAPSIHPQEPRAPDRYEKCQIPAYS